MPRRFGRFAPLTGIAFVALVVAGGLSTGNTPNSDAPLSKVTSFYAAHHDRIFASGILFVYSATFLAFFGSTLWSRIRRIGVTPIVSAATLAGTAVAAVGLTAWGAVNFALGDNGNKHTILPGTLQALHVLTDGMFLPIAAGFEILLLAVAIAGMITRVFPRWLAWVALVIAILQVTPIGFFATLAFLIWTIIVSIWMLVRPLADAPAREAAP